MISKADSRKSAFSSVGGHKLCIGTRFAIKVINLDHVWEERLLPLLLRQQFFYFSILMASDSVLRHQKSFLKLLGVRREGRGGVLMGLMPGRATVHHGQSRHSFVTNEGNFTSKKSPKSPKLRTISNLFKLFSFVCQFCYVFPQLRLSAVIYAFVCIFISILRPIIEFLH